LLNPHYSEGQDIYSEVFEITLMCMLVTKPELCVCSRPGKELCFNLLLLLFQ